MKCEEEEGVGGIGGDLKDEPVVVVPEEEVGGGRALVDLMGEEIGVVGEDVGVVGGVDKARNHTQILEIGGPPSGPHALLLIVRRHHLETFDGGGQNSRRINFGHLLGVLQPTCSFHPSKSIISVAPTP